MQVHPFPFSSDSITNGEAINDKVRTAVMKERHYDVRLTLGICFFFGFLDHCWHLSSTKSSLKDRRLCWATSSTMHHSCDSFNLPAACSPSMHKRPT